MPRFITVGYGDEAGYQRTAIRLLDAAHASDAELLKSGAVMGTAGPPVQVRNTDGKGVETRKGPFMSSALPVAGFAIIEAADLDAAIAMISGSPCAIAQGVVEVWPLEEAGD